VAPASPSPPVPELCVWETTLACNLACRHCGSSAGKARPHELDTHEALALIDALIDLGTCELTVSGGEVFLRSDWRRLIEHARKGGLECLVVSNGVAITRAVADDLAALAVGCVSLSIDGGAQAHDRLRPLSSTVDTMDATTPSTFALLDRAMSNLEAANVPVAAITQVSQANLDELPAIAEFLCTHKIEGWQIQLTSAMGRARDGVAMLAPRALPRLYAFIRGVQAQGRLRCLPGDCIGYFGADESLLRSVERAHDNVWRGCQAGLRVLGITSDGGVKGCLSLPDGYLEGNIRQQPLGELWADPHTFAYNRRFAVETLTGACRGCAFAGLCRAGCHSFAATAQNGDISRYGHCIRVTQAG
jgi:radical SAM protein with 4Fe4S-binding SPASM domain